VIVFNAKPAREDLEELSVSEMIKGDPEPPLLEPILTLLGCLLVISANIFSQPMMSSMYELMPEGFGLLFIDMMASLFLIGNISALMLLISGGVMYFYRPKVGGILAIISGVISFFQLGVMLWGTYGSILGIIAGAFALKTRKSPEPGSRSEVL
jgi:hypothetical protein